MLEFIINILFVFIIIGSIVWIGIACSLAGAFLMAGIWIALIALAYGVLG